MDKIILRDDKGRILKGSHLGKEFQAGQESTFKGKRHTDESKKKNKEKHLGKQGYWTGKKRPPPTEESRQKMREANLNRKNRKFKDTSIEIAIENELIKRGINYLKQVPIDKIAIVDFYLPDINTIIQCDGCFYHNCKIHKAEYHKEQPVIDERQNIALLKAGYKLYRFWEHDINNSASECIDKITIANGGTVTVTAV